MMSRSWYVFGYLIITAALTLTVGACYWPIDSVTRLVVDISMGWVIGVTLAILQNAGWWR